VAGYDEHQTRRSLDVECDICKVKNLIYRYADSIDRGDLEGAAALFSHGRIIALDETGGETAIVGAEAVHGLYAAFTRLYEDDGSPHTLHMTTNVIADIDPGGEAASARSYAVVFQAVDGFPLQPVIGVRYYDRFEKSGQGWRFSERKIETRMAGDLSRHLLRPV
jgi:hypothetical protein